MQAIQWTNPPSPTSTRTLIPSPSSTPTPSITRTPTPDIPSFSREIKPLFYGCNCHGREPGRFDPNNYNGVVGVVSPGNPEGSAIVQMMREGHHAPVRLSSQELEVVIEWIEAGAPNN